MTKKHYEAIAAIMAEHVQGEALAVLYRLADYFVTDNPKFDRARFLQACGVEQDCCSDRPYKNGKCHEHYAESIQDIGQTE